MYYDYFNKVTMSDKELESMGLENASKERLAEIGIFKLEILKPEVEDPAIQGLEPAGEPYSSNEDPYVLIQEMQVYNFLDLFKTQKIECLAQRRWSAQTANYIMEDGTIFRTTPEDRLQISALVQSMRDKGQLEVDFKTASGWITASLAYLKMVNDRITAYIEACFTNERKLAEAIMAATTVDELNEVDTERGWPANAPEPVETVEPPAPDNPDEPAEIDEETLLKKREQLATLATQKADEARIVADAVVVPYMADFSDVEKQTWAKQQAEVAAYLADPASPTPTLDGLAQVRGISREEMLEKAIAKVTAFEPLSVAIVGKQQAYEDQIKAIVADESKSLDERIDELQNMKFDYTLGE